MGTPIHFSRVTQVVIVACLATLLFSTQPVSIQAAPAAQSAAWFDPDWTERMSVLITNPGPAVTDYQLHIPLDSQFRFSLAKSDGSDLRVTASDGTTLLPFWIESWMPGVSASVWVRLPSLASGGNTTLYLYFGNSIAASASSGAAVFDFFDDFEAPFGRPLSNASIPQTTPTYDGSGQVVHPGIVYFPGGWHGYEYWLVMTPYPNGNAAYENPSILVSHDGVTWAPPPGITNPIALPTVSYLADADLMYDAASNQLWVYYPHQSVAGTTYLVRKVSADGINWGVPTDEDRLFGVPDFELLSPAVLYVGGQYRMWSVRTDGGCTSQNNVLEYRTSITGTVWSAPVAATFAQSGYIPWHVEVIHVPSKNEFWALMAAYPSGSACDNTDLFFARSSDGLNWNTYNRVALSPGWGSTWDGAQIYRSTLLYDETNDLLRVWYSANNWVGGIPIWHQGYTERNYTQFLGALSSPDGGGWTIEQGNGDWSPSTIPVRRGTYSGRLVQNSGVDMLVSKPQPVSADFYQEWDMYDDLDTTGFKGVRVATEGRSVGVGVWTGSSTDHYVYHTYDYYYIPTTITRTLGWHKFSVLLRSTSSVTFYIDGQQVGSLNGQFNAATHIDLEGEGAVPSTYYVDDIRIRKYSSPEPVTTLAGPNAIAVRTFRVQATGGGIGPTTWVTVLGLAGSALLVVRARRRRM